EQFATALTACVTPALSVPLWASNAARACAACRRDGCAGEDTAEGAGEEDTGGGRRPSGHRQLTGSAAPHAAVPVQDHGAAAGGAAYCPGAGGGGRSDPGQDGTGYSMT